MTHIITSLCLRDSACVDVCPVEAISMSNDFGYIDQDECTECGVCIDECPVDAIEEK